MPAMKVYTMSGSPFGWRVQLSLHEKGLACETVILSIASGDLRSEEHLARCPHGKVPALEDGDVTLCESSAILEYVEELHPEPTLLGKDPAARAAVRREELECLEYYARVMLPAAQQIFFRKPEERDQELMRTGRRIAAEQLDRLEARLAGHGAPFVQGPELTRADLTWLPFIELAARGEMPLDASRTPALIAWRDRLRERPSYVQTYPPHWRK